MDHDININENAGPVNGSGPMHLSAGRSASFLQDNRPQSAIQKKQAEALFSAKPVQRQANNTGLPDNLKSGIENLSGHAMDDVRVHYNSDKPAQLSAHAYAQGTDIHIASGQEKHLPHEAWHVVQQKQGRVKPTMQMKGKVNVNDDEGLEKEADVMGDLAGNHPGIMQRIEMKSDNSFVSQHVIQPVWSTAEALKTLKNSSLGPASQIVPKNLDLQQEAKDDDNGQKMRASKSFSATGYEFEFAQLAPEERQSEFGKKSHLHLATGETFPLYSNIPFMVETDMGAVIELAMPPLLIPRDPVTKQIDHDWVAEVMLKLERGLKALARNGTSSLASILNAVKIFLGLKEDFIIKEHPDVVGLSEQVKSAQYGHMEKNSRIKGKFSTAQANIVTTLKEAIRMSYDKENLPEEISAMKTAFDEKLLEAGGNDPNDYGIFIAQKISELPYMFLDSLHGKALGELAKKEEEKPQFDLLQKLVGHETSRLEKNKVHDRTDEDGPDITRHTARSTVSRVKGRAFGWIKTTLGKQLRLFSPQLIQAAELLLNDDEKIKSALETTVAYRAIQRYSGLPGGGQIMAHYNDFLLMAIENIKGLLGEHRDDKLVEEQKQLDETGEQMENAGNRHLISSARPDTVMSLGGTDVSYDQDEEGDAALVEIRNPTRAFKIRYNDRTTNKRSLSDQFRAKRALKELSLMNDDKWKQAYMAANPEVNTEGRIEIEKTVFTLINEKKLRQAYYMLLDNGISVKPSEDIFWKKWFGMYDPVLEEQEQWQHEKEEEQLEGQQLKKKMMVEENALL